MSNGGRRCERTHAADIRQHSKISGNQEMAGGARDCAAVHMNSGRGAWYKSAGGSGDLLATGKENTAVGSKPKDPA